jgi:hypothetical protein
MEKDYRDDVVSQINEIVDFELEGMTEVCAEYYLSNWDKYCEELDIDEDTHPRMYLWIVSRFAPDFEEHNI